MVNYSEYFDKFIKESKRNIEDIYFSKSIEHKANVKKIFKLMSDNDAVILDTGCGIGNFLIPLSYLCKFVHGIDFSKESIKLCKERLTKKNINNASVQVSSITKITLNKNSVDKVLCFGVFHHLDFTEINLVIRV